MRLTDWIDRWSTDPSIAFVFEGSEISYIDFAQHIDAAASALSGRGVGAGDRVGFCGLNRVELFETLFACARLGAIFVPFNNRLTVHELAVQIADSDPTVLLATDGFEASLADAADGRPVIDIDDGGWAAMAAAADPLGGEFDGDERSLHPEPAADDAPLLMVYTSGTTGTPRGAMLSHDALVHTTLNSIDHQGIDSSDTIIAPLPTFHVGGLNIQTLPTLHAGGRVVLMRRFDPSLTLDLIAEHRPTQTLLVPAMLAAVAGHERFASTDISCLDGINTGSSVVPEAIMAPYFDRGVPVGQVYGATETGPTATVLPYAEASDRRASCGRPALHTELRIVDENGADVDDGVDGEILLRGPNIFSGYWNNPEATEDAFAEGGWYRTGDVGRRDADGYVYISDRIKDVVISGGENIYPAELEAVLIGHGAIGEVAVVGRPDERWGEVPLAVVVPTPGSSLTLDELHGYCESRLARYKWPRALTLVEELPHTALGKVQKHVLRSRLDD